MTSAARSRSVSGALQYQEAWHKARAACQYFTRMFLSTLDDDNASLPSLPLGLQGIHGELVGLFALQSVRILRLLSVRRTYRYCTEPLHGVDPPNSTSHGNSFRDVTRARAYQASEYVNRDVFSLESRNRNDSFLGQMLCKAVEFFYTLLTCC